MEELEYDHRVHAGSREGDKNLAIRFYMEAIHDEEASLKEGRPIFKDIEFIEKRVRGDRNNVVQRPAYPEDKRNYSDLYRAFKAGEDTPQTGTPLNEWTSLPKSLVQELKYMGFTTVEQLADASDHVCAKMAGLQNLKQRAKLWIDNSKGGAVLDQLSAALAEEKNKSETLQRQMLELGAQVKALEALNEAKAKTVADQPAAEAKKK